MRQIERRPVTGRQIQTRYVLERNKGRCVVIVERPDGPDLVPEPLGGDRPPEYEWGYVGDGPRELAIAILNDVFGELPDAINVQSFADEFIASFPHEGMTLTRAMLLNWLELRFPDAAGLPEAPEG